MWFQPGCCLVYSVHVARTSVVLVRSSCDPHGRPGFLFFFLKYMYLLCWTGASCRWRVRSGKRARGEDPAVDRGTRGWPPRGPPLAPPTRQSVRGAPLRISDEPILNNSSCLSTMLHSTSYVCTCSPRQAKGEGGRPASFNFGM